MKTSLSGKMCQARQMKMNADYISFEDKKETTASEKKQNRLSV